MCCRLAGSVGSRNISWVGLVQGKNLFARRGDPSGSGSGYAAIALSGHETLLTFIVMQALTMGCFAFTSSNLGTLAMEHMAPIAGTASSVQGVVGTIGAALIGFVIGQQFDGTPVPFVVGTALCAAGGFIMIVLTEPRQLFAPIRVKSGEVATCVPEDLG